MLIGFADWTVLSLVKGGAADAKYRIPELHYFWTRICKLIILKITLSLFLFLSLSNFAAAQIQGLGWYSESTTNGITLQNSYPKGGPYTVPMDNRFQGSYLVFFTRVINGTSDPFELSLHFSADSIAIPHSPGTFMKLTLPADSMTMEKRSLFSYGLFGLGPFDEPTQLKKTLNPGEDFLFYVVAFFYQSTDGDWVEERGGNRAELVLNGQDLFYRLLPQVPALPCGTLVSLKE